MASPSYLSSSLRVLSQQAARSSRVNVIVPAAARCCYASSSSSSAAAAASSSPTATPSGQPRSSQLDPGTWAGSSSSTASFANTLASATSPANAKSASEEATGSSTAADSSGLKASLLGGISKLLGYNGTSAMAVRATSDYYDRCSERDEREATFFYEECGIPVSYQSWMSITNMHIWLLSVRFRSLPTPLGKTYIQEMINHYFIHSESLMRGRYKVSQARLIKGYLRDQLYQYHGANMGYDEGLISGNDAVLAAAVWRNIYGAGWGRVGGIKGKLNQDNKDLNTPSSTIDSSTTSTPEGAWKEPLLNANLDPSLPPTPDLPNQQGGYHAGGSGLVDALPLHTPKELQDVQLKEARFAVNLERLVKWIRSEVNRMEKLDDQVVMRALNMQGSASGTGGSGRGSLIDFKRI